MEKFIEISLLYDFYGELLSEKQKKIVDYYYNENLSLAEIAEKIHMSRQGVYDQLKRAEEHLYDYDKRLKLINNYQLNKTLIEDAIEKIDSLEQSPSANKDILKSARRDLYKVLEQL